METSVKEPVVPTLDDLPDIMSVEQAAKYLNVCRATAYNWCKTGALPSFKVGNTRRIRKAAFKTWILGQESGGGQQFTGS